MDQNGSVDTDEIEKLFEESRRPTAKFKIRILMQEMDVNKDNKISPKEFAEVPLIDR